MILKADRIAALIEQGEQSGTRDPFMIIPHPDPSEIGETGSASIDLRLGTWFVTSRLARMSHLGVDNNIPHSSQFTKTTYVPLGEDFFLHPGSFVLGVTLEWLRFPGNLAGYLIGKSGWGRRGLIIATATGVHPGFKGCLTLEMINAGELPIAIKPGMRICQLFLHEVNTRDTDPDLIDQSHFVGERKPTISKIQMDDFAQRVSKTPFLAYE